MDERTVHFGEIYIGPVNSRLYSMREDLQPTIADAVLGTVGEGFKGIGEHLVGSSGGFRLKVSAGSAAFLHSSASTCGQWHWNSLKFVTGRPHDCTHEYFYGTF